MVILLTDRATPEQIKMAGGDWKYSLNTNFKSKYKSLSVKLGKICKLLVENNEMEAIKLTRKALSFYGNVPGRLGRYSLVEHLDKIVSLDSGRMIAAERAMTASIILAR